MQEARTLDKINGVSQSLKIFDFLTMDSDGKFLVGHSIFTECISPEYRISQFLFGHSLFTHINPLDEFLYRIASVDFGFETMI